MTNWKINPSTYDYELTGGVPVQDDTLKTSAYIRLRAQRANWMYAPDLKYGSDFYKSHIRVRNVVTVEETAQRALQPMVDDGRAQEITVETKLANRGYIGMQVTIIDDRGEPQILNFDPIGR